MVEKNKDWRRRAYKNEDFINSSEARPIRVLSELMAPKACYEKKEIKNTIVFFGSARSIPEELAQTKFDSLKAQLNQNGSNEVIQNKLDLAEMELKLSKYYSSATELARLLTEWSMSIIQKEKQFYVCSGGGPGMMEAANLGAEKAGGHSIGLNISLPFEQDPNPYQTKNISFEFHYFFIRKFWFAYMAKSLVVFPGGFGTMDELFELLTLIQTKKIDRKIPIILFGSEFWNDFINFDALIKWGVINKSDKELFKIFDAPEEAYQYLKKILIDLVL